MTAHLFTSRAIILLRDEMCICLDDLQSHLTSAVPTKLELFGEFFDFLADLKPLHKHAELGSAEYYENDEYLNGEILDFSESRGIQSDTQEYPTVDSIRHAFISFKIHGLHHLYKNREAENWYPKVVIRKKIYTNHLTGDIVIYRGTCRAEFNCGRFSQSWTLSQEVAYSFAFEHYLGHAAYENTERVVIKASISAPNIYCYDESDNEYEVIVDERKIINPTIVSEGVLG